jgi:CubicO group peptidase (beta-lactamase class C family)
VTPPLRSGDPEEAAMAAPLVLRAKRLAEAWVADGHTSGLVVLVARRGVIVTHSAFGRLSPEADAPALPRDALFPLASITKPITATAVMCLVEDGLVGLNRPVQEYVPEFAGEGKEHVAVRHLLTHTSGIDEATLQQQSDRKPRPLSVSPAEHQHPAIAEHLFRGYDAPLSQPPGVRMSYSNYGFELLGEIVRRVSGQAFSDFAAERIFRPLGMADTMFVVPEPLRCRIARRRSAAEAVPTAYAGMFETREFEEVPWAAHGAFSTAMDLAVFGQMFLQRGTVGGMRVLGPASVATMTTNQIPGVGLQYDDEHFAEASWGLGWSVHGSREARRGGSLYSARAFEHNGLGGTYMWVDPTYDLVGIYFSLLLRGAPGLNADWCADLFSNVVTAAILDE